MEQPCRGGGWGGGGVKHDHGMYEDKDLKGLLKNTYLPILDHWRASQRDFHKKKPGKKMNQLCPT